MEARDCELDPARTVVVSGVPDGVLPASRIVDKLTVHFQSRRRSSGGDVAHVGYPTNMDGVAFVTFDRAEDAARVVKKKQQIMSDSQFLEDYVLTVFPYSSDIYFYVSNATVDLSPLKGDVDSLIESLSSAHRSLRFKPLPRQRKVSIEGPFNAVQALREDLILRTKQLKSSRAASPSPKVIRHREAPEAKPNVGGQNSVTGRFGDKLKTFTEDAAKQFNHRQVVGEESSDGPLPSRPKMNLHSAEDDSRKHTTTYGRPGAESQTKTYSTDLSSKLSQYSDGEASKRISILLDSYMFQYIEKFHKKELDGCLEGVSMCAKHHEGSGLIRVSLTEQQSARGASRVQEASKKLQTLIQSWNLVLDVQTVFDGMLLDEQDLTRICKDVNSFCSSFNVLYLVEHSCVKVIGRTACCQLFCDLLKDEISNLLSSRRRLFP